MEYYDRNNNKIIIPDEILENYLNNGECGTIYQYNSDSCIKIYNQKYTETMHRLDVRIYQALKEIDSPNLIDIRELYFKEKRQTHYNADAFISKYYEEKYPDFLEVPTDYLLENVEGIISLSSKLSQKKIRLHDLKRENVILADENMIFIDPDMWYYSNLSYREIGNLNINALSSFFNRMVKESLKLNHQDLIRGSTLYFDQTVTNQLFPLTSSANRQIKTLTKRLRNFERPIDYIYSKKKWKKILPNIFFHVIIILSVLAR